MKFHTITLNPITTIIKEITMNKKFLRINDLAKELGVSKTTIWRWRSAGKFPKPISLSERIIVWPRATIDEWINEQTSISPY
jgi:prophage regulatory protein